MMDHVVYVDAKQGELEKLLSGSARAIVRGAAGRKLPYGRVEPGDCLFFVPNDGKCQVRASAAVISVFNSQQLSAEESRRLIAENQETLLLTPAQVQRWSGKRYLVIIGLGAVTHAAPFTIDRSAYGNMDDWLPVGDIQKVRSQR